MLASTRTMLGLDSRCMSSTAPGCGRRCILTLDLIRQPTPGAGRYAELPARHLELAGAALVLILLTSVPLGIGRRAIAIVCRISPYVSSRFWRVDAQLLAGVFTGDGVFGVLQWLPAMGYGGWQHIILPAVPLPLCRWRLMHGYCAPVCWSRRSASRHLGAATRPERQTDERRHILRNASLPMITAVGMQLAN